MPRTHRLTRVVAVAIALAAALSLAGCSSKQQPQAAAPSKPSVPYVVKVTAVTGKLAPRSRRVVRNRVAHVVHDWWDAAYLVPGGSDVFAAFTPGAAKLAQRDADLLSDRDRARGADVRRQGIELDVLAVKGAARGVTARLHLVYDRPGGTTRCGVGGTVSLIPVGHAWRIFGYDVTHTCRPRKGAGS
ncbi:MAG TPA: hypothetical protein VN088_09150 [Nocardioides sp.]|nr:hypothetical protein [Nocardioides sp.]